VKNPLYEDVSEKPMMGMSYPFSAGTLTFVRTIITFVEIFYFVWTTSLFLYS
jgi:hypothetical protein